MTIGEPQHAFPDFVGKILAEHLDGFRKYPDNNGMPALMDAIMLWLDKRYGVSLGADNLLTLNGTREGLFNAAIALGPAMKTDFLGGKVRFQDFCR